MKKTGFLLNKVYIGFLYVISFLTFLSLQIKALSLTPFYSLIIQSTALAYVIIIFLSIISVIFTHLLIHLLRKIQLYQLG